MGSSDAAWHAKGRKSHGQVNDTDLSETNQVQSQIRTKETQLAMKRERFLAEAQQPHLHQKSMQNQTTETPRKNNPPAQVVVHTKGMRSRGPFMTVSFESCAPKMDLNLYDMY